MSNINDNAGYEIKEGYYGAFGGRYVPDSVSEKLDHLANVFKQCKVDSSFKEELSYYLNNFAGRPTPLYYAHNLSKIVGSRIYLKREDLNHTGAHKINNAIGQILIAKRMGIREIVAETGAGQHGVATATVAACFDMRCVIFMGRYDAERQASNVQRMKLLGAEVIEVDGENGTLKDAVDGALMYYMEHPDSYYLIGSQVGPDPYPDMVSYFQKIIGEEARKQILMQEHRLPDAVIACIGGGSNAIGIFSAFFYDHVQLLGAEGGGKGDQLGAYAASLSYGVPMIFQGAYSYCLVDKKGKIANTSCIAAGLDYPGISPQHAYLKERCRASYFSVRDDEALEALRILASTEGIIPAIESAHAVALAIKQFKGKDKLIVINISGRGDKDVMRVG